MSCTISGISLSKNADNEDVPVVAATITIEPLLEPIFIDGQEINNPKRTATTGEDGAWEFADMPAASATSPSTMPDTTPIKWMITLANGFQYTGAIPEDTGEFSLIELQEDHGWALVRKQLRTPIAVQGLAGDDGEDGEDGDDGAPGTNAPVPALSANLIAEWKFDEQLGQTIYNTVGPRTPIINLAGPLEGYNWGTSQFAESPRGDYTAVRVQIVANSSVNAGGFPFVTGQTYVISLYAKSNTGGNQAFRFAKDDGTTFSADQDVTTSWQRFTYSFVAVGGGWLWIQDAAAAAGADLQLWGLQVELGTVPTTFVQPAFQATLGLHAATDSHDPTWIDEGLRFVAASSQYCRAVSDQPFSGQEASVYFVVKRIGSPNLGSYQPLLCTPGFAQDLQLDFGTLTLNQPGFVFSNQAEARANAASNDGAWHLIAGICDGIKTRIMMDDAELGSIAVSGIVTPEILSHLLIGNLNNAAYFAGDIAYASLYNVGHSAAQYATNRAAIQSQMEQRGISIPDLDALIVFEGDSITASYGYPLAEMTALQRQGRNFAVNGSVIANWNARAATIDALVNPDRRCNILSLMGGNDLDPVGSLVPADYVAALKAYCLARRAAGWTIVLMTVTPRTNAGFNPSRNTANALIVADPSFYDFLVRQDLDPLIGGDAAAADTTYYVDGVHPTQAGADIIAANEEAVLTVALS